MNFRDKLKAIRRRKNRSQDQAVRVFKDLKVSTWTSWERESEPREPPLWVQHLVIKELEASPVLKGNEGQYDGRGRPASDAR